jgi:penicillin-binding protein 1B
MWLRLKWLKWLATTRLLPLQNGGNEREDQTVSSIALGAFEVTPIEIARAWTIFANEGRRLEPHALLRVVAPTGQRARHISIPKPRTVSAGCLHDDQSSGGSHLRGYGCERQVARLQPSAAGKTGTSRDGWFAGYTKDFLVIAWVGFDNNDDLNVEEPSLLCPSGRIS